MYRNFLSLPRTLLLVFAVPLYLTACSDAPSDFFRSLDRDSNSFVDLDEWMVYYGQHSHGWDSCSGNDFEPADCDADQRLSWTEYHAYRFEGLRCRPGAVGVRFRRPTLDERRGGYQLPPPRCRIAPIDPTLLDVSAELRDLPVCRQQQGIP